jgi:hypothetical protein
MSNVFSAAPRAKRVFAMLLCSAVMLESASCVPFSGISVANKSGRDLTFDVESDPGVGMEVRRDYHDPRLNTDIGVASGKRVFWDDRGWISHAMYYMDEKSGGPAPVHFPDRSKLFFLTNSPFEVRLILKDDAMDATCEYTIRNSGYGDMQFKIDGDLNLSSE